jgi:hypothetical protein
MALVQTIQEQEMTIGDEKVVNMIDLAALVRNEAGWFLPGGPTPTTKVADRHALFDAAADAIEQLTEQADKFKWQVRDTCVRAEKAESQLAELRGKCAAMLEKWSANSGKHPGTIESIVMKAICAELSTLAAADGGGG